MDLSSRLRFLFAKYLQRQCSTDEIEELVILLQHVGSEKALDEEMQLLWEEARKNKIHDHLDWDKMYSTIVEQGQKTDFLIKKAITRKHRPWLLTTIIFLLVISIITYLLVHPSFHPPAFTKQGTVYYFNTNGNDQNDGSRSRPFKTIVKLNQLKLGAGDTVLFESGQSFVGSIQLDSIDHGDRGRPIVITSTGAAKAVIYGGQAGAMMVSDANYITIHQLALQGEGRKTGNTKDGLAIEKSSNIIVDSVEINGFQKAGLLIYSSSDVEVTRVYAFENGFAGIHIAGDAKGDCHDIHISYSNAEDNPGDPTNLTNHSGNGILAGNCKNVLIEYCTATNNGWDMPRKGNGPVGIWCYEADSIVIQHCISYRNKTSAGAADGGGFDLDGGVTHSVIQYCLSYENEGSGFGIFQYAGASNWFDNTIRYCISENDGNVSPAQAGVFIWNGSEDTNQFKNCFFYNNVVYNNKGAAISYEAQSKNAGFRFYNNIFVAGDSLVKGKETGSQYIGNDWYSLEGGFNMHGIKNFKNWTDKTNHEKWNGTLQGFNIDPHFKSPGGTGIIDPAQLDSFFNYNLPVNSILRKKGLDLYGLMGIDNGAKTFNQSPAPKKGIGACF